MLYIFDLGNVIVDIDFNRVLGTWSDLTRIPLATLKQDFVMGDAFHQHERGEISDEEFAAAMCHEMNMPLSYEQFAHGWQAVFVALRPEVTDIMQKTSRPGAPRGRTLEHQPFTYHFLAKRISTSACCRRSCVPLTRDGDA